MPLLRAQPTLRQSVPMGQRAGRPRRANSNRADGFCCMPWDWRDHLIGARGSVACANVSVCPARTPDPPAVVAGRRRIKPPDLRGRWIRLDVSVCSIPGQLAIQSGVAGGCAEALELFAQATESCAAAMVVAPTAWHSKRTSGCATATARTPDALANRLQEPKAGRTPVRHAAGPKLQACCRTKSRAQCSGVQTPSPPIAGTRSPGWSLLPSGRGAASGRIAPACAVLPHPCAGKFRRSGACFRKDRPGPVWPAVVP